MENPYGYGLWKKDRILLVNKIAYSEQLMIFHGIQVRQPLRIQSPISHLKEAYW